MACKVQIKKLFREHFGEPNDSPQREGLRVKVQKKRGLSAAIGQRYKNHARVGCYCACVNWVTPAYFEARIGIRPPDSSIPYEQHHQRRVHHRFSVMMDGPHGPGLWIEASPNSITDGSAAPVDWLEQLDAFFEAVVALPDIDEETNVETFQLANETLQRFDAELQRLGKQHAFSYSSGFTLDGVRLSLRVGNRKAATHISFPLEHFEPMCDRASELIEAVEALASFGIEFRSDNTPWTAYQSDWVEPAKVDDA